MVSITRDRAATFSEAEQNARWPPWPAPDETEEEKNARIEAEQEAKRVSDDIDSALEAEKKDLQKRRPQAKILLLGQAESGKSTLLKNFQLQFTPKAFKAEAEAWRAVIHLNLLRSVSFLLDVLDTGGPPAASRPVSPGGPAGASPTLRRLKMRLLPLRRVEALLAQRLSVTTEEGGTPWYQNDRAFEVSVRSGSGWKALLKRSGERTKMKARAQDELDESLQVIEACADDMAALWADDELQTNLREESVFMQEQSGFFLGEVRRIAARDYLPTSEDILRARLQTLGVEEHRLTMETSAEAGKEWVIYDVGGSRGQRAAWAPYFDDVATIIFLAPVSAFNQCLSEDRSVNRLWDTFALWEAICGNKHLQDVTLILLLNKCDVLDAKLKAGVRFAKFVTSYKDQPNDLEHVSKYLKNKFTAIFRQYSPKTRKLHLHMTCAVDIDAMSKLLVGIREVILVKNLQNSDFL